MATIKKTHNERIVIALGGNALGNNAEEQLERIKNSTSTILDLIRPDSEIIVTHGNGPQVGMIQKAFTIAAEQSDQVPEMPLVECGAMSQGYIGYHLQQGLGKEIARRGKGWHVATVITQMEVDPADPSFQNPSKPIGAFIGEEAAKRAMTDDPSVSYIEDAGRGWRRVVASPKPKAIVEAESIMNLLDDEFIVICCGGGGIPVVKAEDGFGYRGVPAVIDKDLGAERLAEDVDARELILLTAVDHVAINFNKPDQQDFDEMTVEQAKGFCEAGQFAAGSMLPKVLACIKFAESGKGRTAIIGSLEKAAELLKGTSGTRIHL
jgi:carbamate kinase